MAGAAAAVHSCDGVGDAPEPPLSLKADSGVIDGRRLLPLLLSPEPLRLSAGGAGVKTEARLLLRRPSHGDNDRPLADCAADAVTGR